MGGEWIVLACVNLHEAIRQRDAARAEVERLRGVLGEVERADRYSPPPHPPQSVWFALVVELAAKARAALRTAERAEVEALGVVLREAGHHVGRMAMRDREADPLRVHASEKCAERIIRALRTSEGK